MGRCISGCGQKKAGRTIVLPAVEMLGYQALRWWGQRHLRPPSEKLKETPEEFPWDLRLLRVIRGWEQCVLREITVREW